jgi:hypothetical protein
MLIELRHSSVIKINLFLRFSNFWLIERRFWWDVDFEWLDSKLEIDLRLDLNVRILFIDLFLDNVDGTFWDHVLGAHWLQVVERHISDVIRAQILCETSVKACYFVVVLHWAIFLQLLGGRSNIISVTIVGQGYERHIPLSHYFTLFFLFHKFSDELTLVSDLFKLILFLFFCKIEMSFDTVFDFFSLLMVF